MHLDSLDRRILSVLQEDVTLAGADLAERVGSSKSVVWRRVQALVEGGVIERRVAILDPKKIGYNVIIFALVKISRHNANGIPKFVEAVKAIPQVLEVHITLGQVDVLLKIAVSDIDEYRRVVWSRLSELEVQEVSSLVSFEQAVNRTGLPIR